MAVTLNEVLESCRKFNMNNSAKKDEFDKIYNLLIACEFDTLRKTDNIMIMALEREGMAWVVECRMTPHYNMFKDWKTEVESNGFKGLKNLSEKVWGYKKTRVERVRIIHNATRIEDLNLSVRSYNVLKRADFNTVGDIRRAGVEVLARVRNLGRASLKEICKKCNIEVPDELLAIV